MKPRAAASGEPPHHKQWTSCKQSRSLSVQTILDYRFCKREPLALTANPCLKTESRFPQLKFLADTFRLIPPYYIEVGKAAAG